MSFKLAFATLGCPEWSLEHAIREARRMGYEGIEIRGTAGNHLGPDESPDSLAQINYWLNECGITVASVMGYTNFADPEQRSKSEAYVRGFLPVLRAIDCPVLRIFAGSLGDVDREAAIAGAADVIRPLAQEAADVGVVLALETHDDWCKSANLMALLHAVDSAGLGVCWDVANSWTVEPFATTHAALKEYVCHVYLKDVKIEGEKHVACLPGEGIVDLRQAVNVLLAGKYAGFVSFEWEKKWQPTIPEPEVALPHFAQYVRSMMPKKA